MVIPFGIVTHPMVPHIGRTKKSFWSNLKQVINKEKRSWLIIGDIKEITDETKKFGGGDIWKMPLFLKTFLTKIGEIDLGHPGKCFTWDNRQRGMALIRKRLD